MSLLGAIKKSVGALTQHTQLFQEVGHADEQLPHLPDCSAATTQGHTFPLDRAFYFHKLMLHYHRVQLTWETIVNWTRSLYASRLFLRLAHEPHSCPGQIEWELEPTRRLLLGEYLQGSYSEHSLRPGCYSYKRQGNTADNLKLPAESPKSTTCTDTLFVLEPKTTGE